MSSSDTPPQTGDAVAEVRGLVKTVGRVRALDGMDLTGPVRRGPRAPRSNGAGKSTTLRILLGLMRAAAGTARLFGQDPWTNAPDLHRRLA
ncbi:hypothetical protein GCM10023350_30990 [Nocardioides endophyticus]|uniref:ATP-binding cassette domain-containing protein n=1 Tax=Nocardioides endophyticus TaxID=1353775 RepID=A0ABP8Z200_9ACTN